jgi:protein O-GlcNAc transferase
MKIISFSIWGNDPMYGIGAVENIKLAEEIYPGWRCRFFVDNSVPQETVEKIKSMNADVCEVESKRSPFWWGMFWRFVVIDDPNVEVFISRDTDSRLNYREKVAVDEWLVSDKGIHVMHDHPHHVSVPMLGGMWGAKKGSIANMTEKIATWNLYHCKGIDQTFLTQRIWPTVKNNCLRHDDGYTKRWGPSKPFPSHPPLKFDGTYVGQIFDFKNRPIGPPPA